MFPIFVLQCHQVLFIDAWDNVNSNFSYVILLRLRLARLPLLSATYEWDASHCNGNVSAHLQRIVGLSSAFSSPYWCIGGVFVETAPLSAIEYSSLSRCLRGS